MGFRYHLNISIASVVDWQATHPTMLLTSGTVLLLSLPKEVRAGALGKVRMLVLEHVSKALDRFFILERWQGIGRSYNHPGKDDSVFRDGRDGVWGGPEVQPVVVVQAKSRSISVIRHQS